MKQKSNREVVDTIRQHRRQMEAIIQLANLVDDYDKFERQYQDLQVNHRKLQDESAELTKTLEGLKAEIAQAQTESKKAKQAGAKLTADAKAEADQIKKNAETEAANIRAQAGKDAEAARAAAKADVTKAKGELADINGQIKHAKDELVVRKAEITAAQKKVASIKSQMIKQLEEDS